MAITKYRTNLNCASCVAAVTPHLNQDPEIEQWSVDTAHPHKILTIKGKNISRQSVEQHVAAAGFEIFGEVEPTEDERDSAMGDSPAARHAHPEEGDRSWWATYRPLLLILAYVSGVVIIAEVTAGSFSGMRAMSHFMGGWFLAFSFFKLLDLEGFVKAFRSYDIVARPLGIYGYLYPFLELGLGIAYLLRISPFATNAVALLLMGIGIVGVLQALMKKREIQCGCLGTVFQLPMTRVTLIENLLMAGMAATMLSLLL